MQANYQKYHHREVRPQPRLRAERYIRKPASNLGSAEAICDFIKRAHQAYMKLKNTVEGDCRHIVSLCQQVVEAVILLIHKENALESAVAA